MIKRAVHMLLAAGLVAFAAVTLGSTAAQAASYTCVYGQSVNLYNAWGVSHVTMTVQWQCSDGRFHANGTLYDDKCDARSGDLILVANGVVIPLTGEFVDQWDAHAIAGNGCGTHSTFNISKPAVEVPPDSTSGDARIYVGACNSTGCAMYTHQDILVSYS